MNIGAKHSHANSNVIASQLINWPCSSILKKTQKILPPINRKKNPINRNGVKFFVCFVIEVSQQHLPIWAQWRPGRGSPGGTRIYWASSMTWERPGDHWTGKMAMGKMGEIMEVPKNQQGYAMFMGLMINHRIFFGGFFEFQNHETQFSCFISLFIASCPWLQWMTSAGKSPM